MNSSEKINELAQALSQAQAEMPSLQKDTKNPYFDSKYADLGQVIEKSVPVMKEHGLSISQFNTSVIDEGNIYIGLRTILMHSSGQWIEDVIYLPALAVGDKDSKKVPNYPQLSGIFSTYLRRYGWASVLGLYTDDDMDGNMKGAPEVNVDAVILARKEIGRLYKSFSPETKETAKVAMTSLGYDNSTTDITIMVKVISELNTYTKQGEVTNEN